MSIIKEAAERVLQRREHMQELERQLQEATSKYCEAVGEYLEATRNQGPIVVVGDTLIRRKVNGHRGHLGALEFETVNVL